MHKLRSLYNNIFHFHSKHDVLSIDDYQSEKENGVCPDHQEVLKLFCESCDKFICMECKVLGSHASHPVVHIKETTAKLKVCVPIVILSDYCQKSAGGVRALLDFDSSIALKSLQYCFVES